MFIHNYNNANEVVAKTKKINLNGVLSDQCWQEGERAQRQVRKEIREGERMREQRGRGERGEGKRDSLWQKHAGLCLPGACEEVALHF